MESSRSQGSAPPGHAGRRLLLGVSLLAIGTVVGIDCGYWAEAKRCRQHTRRCKTRCERRYAASTRELAVCQSLCGVGCWD